MKWPLCMLIGFVLGLLPLGAKPYLTIGHISDNNEAVQGKITFVTQDNKGFIWFSSFNGLHKYDGYTIRKYKSGKTENRELTSNRIDYIKSNSKGDIWCLASGRLYLFSAQDERFIDVQQVFENKYDSAIVITEFYPLSNGITWMISDKGTYFRFHDDAPLLGFDILKPSLGDKNNIFDIRLDKTGNEWILTQAGTYIYGQDKPLNQTPFVFFVEAKQEVWLSSLNGRIEAYSLKGKKTKAVKPSFGIGKIHHQYFGQEGMLITATDKGVLLTDLNTGTTSVKCQKEWNRVYCDGHKNLWGISADREVGFIDRAGQYHTAPISADIRFNDLRINFKEDVSGTLWLYFYDSGDIVYFDPVEMCFKKPENPYNGPFPLYGYFEDKQGNIWYRQNGKLDIVTIHNTTSVLQPNPGNAELRSMMVDNSNRLWLADKSSDVQIYEHGRLTGRLMPDGHIANGSERFGASVYCSLIDSKKRIWLGTKYDGLFLLEPTANINKYTVRHFKHQPQNPYALQCASVYAIIEDHLGNIWIGTFGGGLHLWDDGKFIHWNNPAKLKTGALPEYIRHMKEVAPGIIMIGSRNGLYVLDAAKSTPQSLSLYRNLKSRKPKSLSDNDVMFIYKTKNGQVYLATNSGGVNMIESKNLLSNNLEFAAITKEDGLASDIIYSIAEDNDGNLWVASFDALSCIKANSTDIAIYKLANLGYADYMSEGAPIAQNNLLYYGTSTGLLSFSPSQMQKSNYNPPLELTDLLIQNEPSTKRISIDNAISLRSDERNIAIRFSALDFCTPAKIKYAIFLENVDKQWTITDENSITYLNIPSGHHRLHIKSTNADGIWTDNERIFSIDVAPRFFESFWGYLTAGGLMVLLVVMAFVVYRKFFLLRHRLVFEQQMTDIKLNFFTDISHELRTPLTLIDGPLSEIMQDDKLSNHSKYYLDIVQRNTRRMLVMVNQILDFRKLQHHRMEMLLEPIEVGPLLKNIMQSFEGVALQRNINFKFSKSSPNIDTLWLDRDKFEKICFNLISNAFKYTSNGKNILVSVGQENDRVVVKVTDQGIGIPSDRIPDLFRRFETVLKNNLFKPSSGIGLALVKQFADLHHAEIQVTSEIQKGSSFSVIFRTGRKHFENDKVDYMVANPIKRDRETVNEAPSTKVTDMQQPLILVVEDNDDLRDFICNMLCNQYRVIEARNGAEGLELCKHHWPELVISDVMMPEIDGFEMVRRIKEDKDICHTPIILLTAKAELDDRIGGVELGVDDYVSKPFSVRYLKSKVNAIVTQRKLLKQQLMALLAENREAGFINIEPAMPSITSSDELFLNGLMAFMEKNMENAELSVSDLANTSNMSRTVFTNKLKALLGLTPVEFVQEIRIKRAKQLLSTKNFTVSEVAFKTGFNDPKYFSLCFKKYFNVRPSDFLKQ